MNWKGYSIYNLSYPLFQNDRLVGHIWVNITEDDLYAFSLRKNIQHLLFTILIYILILLFTRFAYYRVSNNLSDFAHAVIDGADYPKKSMFPELEPLMVQIRKHQRDMQMATISQFAASVVHEVRNPITSIRGFSQLLLDKETDPKKREYIELILEEMDTVSDIVTTFLRFTKPALPEITCVPVRDLIQDLENLTGVLCLENRVALTIEATDDSIIIQCDFSQFKQVMLNLIQNAIQAMEGKENKRLSIHIIRRGEMVQFDVCDNGTGISEEHMVKLFEPFFTTKGTGSGLGLSTCRQLIEQQGGSIEVSTVFGEGSKFSVLLPGADEADACKKNGQGDVA